MTFFCVYGVCYIYWCKLAVHALFCLLAWKKHAIRRMGFATLLAMLFYSYVVTSYCFFFTYGSSIECSIYVFFYVHYMDLTLGLLSGHWSHLCLAWCTSRIEAFSWGKKSKKIVLTSSGLPRSIDTPLQQQQTCPFKETPCGFPNWKLGQSADHAGQVAQQRA